MLVSFIIILTIAFRIIIYEPGILNVYQIFFSVFYYKLLLYIYIYIKFVILIFF
jgi:hypothetical protein